ncbi:MAG: chromate efflux transporter, partial [Verrucomicrobia bacterium]|nr:chromate efflux transporter [Verrucomicrobiota bacterium]
MRHRHNSTSGPLGEVATVFLKLGAIAFGGPAAHLALMEDEVVHRRNWVTRAEFLDLVGATNLIPGPNSTELAIYLGHRRAGWAGLCVAGASFILPAAFLVTVLAWAYVRWGSLPSATGLLYGVKPVIIAVIAQALWRLGQTALKTKGLGAVGLAAAALNLWGWHELVVLFGAGLLVAGTRTVERWQNRFGCAGLALGLVPGTPWAASVAGAAAVTATTTATPFGLGALFWFFLKVGAVLFGSGYVLLAFLRADLVERWAWLTESQLLDAIAVGQVTPGPLFTTATFVGYLLGGPLAALLATVGIFLPAFIFVAVSGPLLPRLRASRVASAFLDGLNVASLALMAVVTWRLGATALVDGPTVALTLVAAVLLLCYRVNSAWLVLGGAAVGLLAAVV